MTDPGPRPTARRIVWEGAQFELHSYARVNRAVCDRLARRGHDVVLVPTDPPGAAPGPDYPPALAARLPGLYSACDCLVHPFRGEGFALPVAEAMACGLPVVATDAGPVTDYCDAATGYLVPARRHEWDADRVGEFETAGRPWHWEPDAAALADALRDVVGDPAGPI